MEIALVNTRERYLVSQKELEKEMYLDRNLGIPLENNSAMPLVGL